MQRSRDTRPHASQQRRHHFSAGHRLPHFLQAINNELPSCNHRTNASQIAIHLGSKKRFEVAILTDRLLKRATRDIMWTPQTPSDGLGRMVYGLGWQAGTTDGIVDVGHGGSQQGTSTMMLIAPDARAGVVVLINSDAAGASELAAQLLEIVLGLPLGDHKETAVDPKLFDGYVGSYEVTSFVIGIVREGDHLFAQMNGQKNEIFPESIRDYFFKAFDSQITFLTDGNGRATELIFHEGGTDLRANRIK